MKRFLTLSSWFALGICLGIVGVLSGWHPAHAQTPTTTASSSSWLDTSVRANNQKLVQACAAKTAPGASVVWKKQWSALCTASEHLGAEHPYAAQSDTTDYTLTRLPDESVSQAGKPVSFEIDADIVLDIQPGTPAKRAPKGTQTDPRSKPPSPAPSQEAVLENTERCMPVLNHYWNNYGIDLKFRFALKEPGQADTPNTIRVVLAQGRSNSKTFYYNGLDSDWQIQSGIKIPAGLGRQVSALCQRLPGAPLLDCQEKGRQVEYCEMALHEFGHRLGLPDEYEDKANCPDRAPVSTEQRPWSIMAVPMVAPVDGWAIQFLLGIDLGALKSFGLSSALLRNAGLPNEAAAWFDRLDDQGMAEFFPRHLIQVLKPLCPGE